MATQNNANFFNFTADCVGYLNEVKQVKPKKGNPFVAIKATIIEGKDGEEKIAADLILRGAQASQVLQSLEDEWPQGFGHSGPIWFAGLRIGSLDTKPFLKNVFIVSASAVNYRHEQKNLPKRYQSRAICASPSPAGKCP